MDHKKCKVCGQDWEPVLLSGRCARCEVEYTEGLPPDPDALEIAWELDGSITEDDADG